VAQLSWVPAGRPNQYAVVRGPDTYGLAGNWSQVSGGLLGIGASSQAQFTNAVVVTRAIASTCPGDTDATSPTCAPPTLQPNANAYVGGNGTAETNNLTAIGGTPSVSYPNSDLAVTSITGWTGPRACQQACANDLQCLVSCTACPQACQNEDLQCLVTCKADRDHCFESDPGSHLCASEFNGCNTGCGNQLKKCTSKCK
jgi:hypothetical protein